uniref:RNA-binding protein NOB1 n=1 Tax=Strongyloides papillosus TaxID=174720 RepID=A0A0N5BAC3_STREA
MRAPEDVPVTHLIVDAAGFLKKARLIDIGSKLYTTSSVIGEIKDKATKEYIQSIPYDIEIKEPSKESLSKVIEVAKKTGDYPSLSGPDLGIIALTLDIHISNVGEDSVNYEVKSKVQEKKIEKKSGVVENLVGFINPKDDDKNTEKDDEAVSDSPLEEVDEENNQNNMEEEDKDLSEEENESFESNDESTDDEGWITPSNFSKVVTKFDPSMGVSNEHQEVACLSTDFAVQNVLKHMELGIVSVDGYQIKVLKSYILRCRACFTTTSVMTKRFCPKCGHSSLDKVGVTVKEDGEMVLHINYDRLHSKRGLIYSLPTFKGGKHSKDPIIFEDQRVPHNRMATVHDSKHIDSPFALNDVTSRSAMLGLRSYEKHLGGNRNLGGRGRKRGGKKR